MKKLFLILALISLFSCNKDLECDVQRLEIIEAYDRKIDNAGSDVELIRLLKLERDMKIDELNC